jgi:hypothetical protein
MKKLVLKLAVLSLAGLTTYCLLGLLLPERYNHLLSAIINKTEILKKTPSPKIILIGGSGVACGIDSKQLEKKFKYPVVNMGMWAGFGIKYYIENVKPYVNKNDIILLIPEYATISDTYILNAIKYYPEAGIWFYSTARQAYLKTAGIYSLPRDIFHLIRLRINCFIECSLLSGSNQDRGFIFFNQSYNNNGDQLNLPQKDIKDLNDYGLKYDFLLSDSALDFLNDFSNYAQNRGAKIYFLYAAFPYTEYKRNEAGIITLNKKLKDRLKIPILGEPTDFTFPYAFFADTVNHLNQKGRLIRTNKLIKILDKQLAAGS